MYLYIDIYIHIHIYLPWVIYVWIIVIFSLLLFAIPCTHCASVVKGDVVSCYTWTSNCSRFLSKYSCLYLIIPALYLRNCKNKKISHFGTLQSVITGAEGSVLDPPWRGYLWVELVGLKSAIKISLSVIECRGKKKLCKCNRPGGTGYLPVGIFIRLSTINMHLTLPHIKIRTSTSNSSIFTKYGFDFVIHSSSTSTSFSRLAHFARFPNVT